MQIKVLKELINLKKTLQPGKKRGIVYFRDN